MLNKEASLDNYDLIVIGAGPGGYVAAIRAAQLGKKVVIIEKDQLGGACLNVGCIPSKTFLKHSEWLLTLQEANQYGIENRITKIDIKKLVARKCSVVNSLREGIKHLFQKNKIDLIRGQAQFNKANQVIVGSNIIKGKKIILATGSRPFIPSIKGIDQVKYDTTDSFFDLNALPKQLVIIGGGVIGVELAFSIAPLGVETTIVEVAKDILLTEDSEARDIIKKELKKLNITIIVNAQLIEVKDKQLVLQDSKITFDKLLVATGRVASLELAKQAGLLLTTNAKFIQVNDKYQTSNSDIYAIGDVIGSWMLAHAASEEGLAAVNALFNPQAANKVQQNLIPRCVYSFPEIASVGLTEEQAKSKGLDITIKKQPFAVNGKAISANETLGFVKIIIDKKYGEVLGAVVVGTHATEMIHIILSIMQAEGTIDDLATQVFAHPTLSEVIGETAKSLIFKAIHE